MDDQKLENVLNLAIDASKAEREKSLDLGVGFDTEANTWELIVKYTGDIRAIAGDNISVVELLNNYAIITVPENRVDEISNLPQIEYVEKPKRLFFAVNNGISASCITSLQTAQYNLFGEGAIVAVIDSGVDYSHPDFRNEDGTTRILDLWDQTINQAENEAANLGPPEGYRIGTLYPKAVIDKALSEGDILQQRQIVPSVDLSGHGTSVLGIAAGNGRASNGLYRGVASRSDIIVVKLGTPRAEGFPRTTELMQGINFVISRAMYYGKPIAINLSFGNTYGPHDGTSLLERFIDDMAGTWKNSIAIGTGNEGAASGHTSGQLVDSRVENIELAVGAYAGPFNVQIWKNFVDEVDIEIIAPGGTSAGPLQHLLGPQRFVLENTELLLYYGEPSPYSKAQEIYVEFIPRGSYVTEGIWTFRLIPRRIVDGQYNFWLPSVGALSAATRFLYPNPNLTITIPSTAMRSISVAAYNSAVAVYAPFSGRGFLGYGQVSKPDLAAPGVDITAAAVGGGYRNVTGTSFATPFVTGSAALMMQWGIAENNDPFLYGEKIKAYLIAGAKPLSGIDEYPNELIGYGTLCLRNSFDRLTR